MKTLSLLIALALPAAVLASPPTAGTGHGVPLQGDCKDGVKSPGHHKENDGRPKHGDGCGR
ncbi:hypothetical protein [Lacisediminimonas sp.]|uniref:hypothetical protein n=1 Tax=Lacisediminimonas sp. TaxID=3060582 RepID=UPI00271BAE0C|nr:hypothetical protein [Lacisediminimonas sp.]MDO8299051.1 hypothetical protein [Lacisediminimonas sp.]